MKTYPSITKDIRKDLTVYVFDKLDGSNIRAEWSKKKGFYKFGSRRVLLDKSNQTLGEAIDLIKNNYEDDITKIMKKNRFEKGVFFFEFYGPNSFAGNHVENEKHEVTLFDVDIFKRGILPPDIFLKEFGNLKIAPLLYHGKINSEMIQSIKDSTFDGITFEGVVCKAKNPKKTLRPILFKIKTHAWLNKLKQFCKDDAEMFKRLS